MSKLDTFLFTYVAKFVVNNDSSNFEVIGFNVPNCYKTRQDERAHGDIRYAIQDEEIIKIENLKPNTCYDLEIECRYIQNLDNKTYNQVFSLKLLKESEPTNV